MMAMPIMVVTSVKTVAAKKSSKGPHRIRERAIIYEGSAGPRELLEATACCQFKHSKRGSCR